MSVWRTMSIWCFDCRVVPLVLGGLLGGLFFGRPALSQPAPGVGGHPEHADVQHKPGDEDRAVSLNRPGDLELFAKFTCMCGTCPRLLLSKCGCGFAQRERQVIRGKMALGWDEKKIIDWYVNQRGAELGKERFGLRVLSTPPETGLYGLYWVIPYFGSVLAVLALIALGYRWKRRTRQAVAADAGATPPAEAQAGTAGDDTAGERAYADLLDDELKKLD